MNILALDCGTKTGYATNLLNGEGSGVVDFKPKARESGGMRFLRFASWLSEMFDLVKPSVVTYEMPHNRGGSATEVLNGMVAIVQKECASRGIEYTSVHSATLKKFATGSGRANKEDMIQACNDKLSKSVKDDNEADALWLLEYAKEEFGREGK